VPMRARTMRETQPIQRALDSRPNAAVRGYDAKWARYARRYLRQHPLCVACQADGYTTAAVLVDHIKPLAQGGPMWDPANHQALCTPCHNHKTGSERRTSWLAAAARRAKPQASHLVIALLLAMLCGFGCTGVVSDKPISVPTVADQPYMGQQDALPANVATQPAAHSQAGVQSCMPLAVSILPVVVPSASPPQVVAESCQPTAGVQSDVHKLWWPIILGISIPIVCATIVAEVVFLFACKKYRNMSP
jgi:5-methylcytosine-specific restriction enzyme A